MHWAEERPLVIKMHPLKYRKTSAGEAPGGNPKALTSPL